MKTHILKKIIVVTLAVLMTHAPELLAAEVAQAEKMISTVEWANQETRKEVTDKISHFLDRSDVVQQLQKSGVAPEEVKSRLASLSDVELQNLSSEVDKAQYGGDVTGVLVVVLLVVLIIYLIKRI